MTGAVVGLDLSLTSIGVAVIYPGGAVDLARIQPGKTTGCQRLAIILARVMNYALDGTFAVIEGPSYGSNTGSQHERSGLWWLIAHELWTKNIDYLSVPPATLKRYATGKGNAPKDQVLAAAIRRFPHTPVDGNDQADALWLAAIGTELTGQPITQMPARHRAAITGLKAPAALRSDGDGT